MVLQVLSAGDVSRFSRLLSWHGLLGGGVCHGRGGVDVDLTVARARHIIKPCGLSHRAVCITGAVRLLRTKS